jgi:hypothetical protein
MTSPARRRRPLAPSPAALAALVAGGGLFSTLAACGAASDDDAAFADRADTGGSAEIDATAGGGPTPDAPDAAAEPTDLTGTWAQRQVTVSNVDVPVVGTTRTPTVSLLLVEATPADAPGAFDLHLTTCGITMGSDADPARTVVPDAFVSALPEVDRRAVIGDDGTYTVDWLTQVHGARLTDPENDALPTSADDPRVIDQDEDGRPGLTVRVTGLVDGEVYVAQRGRDRMVGRLADGRVDGLVEWTSEQAVLDAEVELLRTPVPSRPEPDPAAHVFGLRRLPAGATCADVVVSAPALFGPDAP